jgi:outer membrane protein TolC
MARRQFEDFSNQVDFTLEDSLARLRRNTDQVALYRTGIIPQAQQSFDASLAAYQVGKLELLSLLDSLMTLYRYQIDYQRALTDALRDAARLEAATGSSLAP